MTFKVKIKVIDLDGTSTAYSGQTVPDSDMACMDRYWESVVCESNAPIRFDTITLKISVNVRFKFKDAESAHAGINAGSSCW